MRYVSGMQSEELYQTLLRATRDVYAQTAAMMSFAPFPDDIERQAIVPYHCPCSDAFAADTALASQNYSAVERAIRAAGPVAHWRETYKNTDIGGAFMDQFGCYCIIGENGPFTSERIRLYMVYMPKGLYYPWHHHPAEEMYMVLSGSAVFRREGLPEETLGEGDCTFHASNQPHAMETVAAPVLCLVVWRDAFETPPVLTR